MVLENYLRQFYLGVTTNFSYSFNNKPFLLKGRCCCLKYIQTNFFEKYFDLGLEVSFVFGQQLYKKSYWEFKHFTYVWNPILWKCDA